MGCLRIASYIFPLLVALCLPYALSTTTFQIDFLNMVPHELRLGDPEFSKFYKHCKCFAEVAPFLKFDASEELPVWNNKYNCKSTFKDCFNPVQYCHLMLQKVPSSIHRIRLTQGIYVTNSSENYQDCCKYIGIEDKLVQYSVY